MQFNPKKQARKQQVDGETYAWLFGIRWKVQIKFEHENYREKLSHSGERFSVGGNFLYSLYWATIENILGIRAHALKSNPKSGVWIWWENWKEREEQN